MSKIRVITYLLIPMIVTACASLENNFTDVSKLVQRPDIKDSGDVEAPAVVTSEPRQLIEQIPGNLFRLNVVSTPLPLVLEKIGELSGVHVEILGKPDCILTLSTDEGSFEMIIRALSRTCSYPSLQRRNKYTILAEGAADEAEDEIVDYIYRPFSLSAAAVVAELDASGIGDLAYHAVEDQDSVILSGSISSITRAFDYLMLSDNIPRVITMELMVVEYFHGSSFAWDFNILDATISKFSGIKYTPGVLGAFLSIEYNSGQPSTDDTTFRANLTALVEQGVARVVTNPHVAVVNGETGTIDLVETLYLVLTHATEALGTLSELDQLEAGVSLTITPKVIGWRDIYMDIAGEVAVFLDTSPGSYSINRNKISTKVVVKDHERLVIGGLLKEIRSESNGGVPGFRSIPLIGKLFSKTSEKIEYAETVIYLTPHLESRGRFTPEEVSKRVREMTDGKEE